MIHAVFGTKAQTIKLAPILRRLADRGAAIRLVDTGQHAAHTGMLRSALGLPEPAVHLAGGEVTGLARGVTWAARLAARLVRPAERLRSELFGGRPGPVLLHGDNASTALGALLARRAGLPIALVEAGLSSGSLAEPFPEELLRRGLPHLADLLFAPSEQAADRLRAARVGGRVVVTPGNTGADALRDALGPDATVCAGRLGLWTLHRLENLYLPRRLDRWCRLMEAAAQRGPVRLVLDAPTAGRLGASGWDLKLRRAGVELKERLAYPDFARLMATSAYVATDGGSQQEECAILGVPCLLLRRTTERPDGLGENAVLARDEAVARAFLADPGRHRRRTRFPDRSPSEVVAETLLGFY